MPQVSAFYGIVIWMYYADHDPPHFHAAYAEHEALFTIEDRVLLRGWLPKRARRLVRTWAALHTDELADDWDLARRGLPLLVISPLP